MSIVTATRAEICAAACADAWRGDGELLASPFGTIPTVGARLARATFEPDLLLTDGEAAFAAGTWPVGEQPRRREGYVPFRSIFELVWSGRRHVMMIPSQLDRAGNANISCIGEDYDRPKVQLLGVRGAPGNTVSHPTSYWIPRHSPRALVERVDMVAGVGPAAAAAAGPAAERFLDLRVVVTDLAVLDFRGAGGTLRLRSLHPGVTLEQVQAATGFELATDGEPATTRLPSDEELRLIREVIDPRGLREREVPSA
ncbi:MAG TPA: CoA-transferase [Conexibacter sp.]|nr:CoA-transferase [Conexibacter sp.]